MAIGILIIAIFLLVSILSIRLCREREGLYSTVFFFSIGAAIYFISLPVEMIIKNASEFPIDLSYDISIAVEQSVYYKISFMGIMAVVGFTFGHILSGFRSKSPDSINLLPDIAGNKGRNKLFEKAIFLFLIGTLLTLLLIFPSFLPSMHKSYSSAYDTKYHNPLPMFIYELFYIANAIFATALILKRRFFCSVVGALLFVVNFLLTINTYIKAPAVVAILGCGYCYFFLAKNKKAAMFSVLAGILIILFVLVPLFSASRHPVAGQTFVRPFELLANNFRVSFINTDAGGPMAVTVMAVNKESPLMLGETYVRGLSLFIPRFLWPNRPLDIAESFARNNMINWKPGQGLGFGPIAEGYINFGTYACFIEFFLFGLLWGTLWRVFIHITKFFNAPVHFDIIYRIIGFYIILQFLRGFIMGAFKPLLMLLIPFTMVLMGAYIFQKSYKVKDRV